MRVFSPKQPSEAYFLEFDFSRPLTEMGDAGCSIDAVSIVDLSDDNVDVTEVLMDAAKNVASGTSALVYVRAGEDGHRYKITVRVVGDINGELFELDAVLPVREV